MRSNSNGSCRISRIFPKLYPFALHLIYPFWRLVNTLMDRTRKVVTGLCLAHGCILTRAGSATSLPVIATSVYAYVAIRINVKCWIIRIFNIRRMEQFAETGGRDGIWVSHQPMSW